MSHLLFLSMFDNSLIFFYQTCSSEFLHNKTHATQMKESETSYCFEALWPFLRTAAHAVSTLTCDFKVGETKLKALKCDGKTKNYNADGVIFDKEKHLELLLLESSGHLGMRDRHRHVFDHIKGAYGCYSMLLHILDKYPHADKKLISSAKVLFVHSSAKGSKNISLFLSHLCTIVYV